MNENLTKILKNCPKGQRFYSTIYGDVEFIGYDKTVNAFVFNPINIINVDSIYIEEDGKYSFAGECILFPSKDQRDWSKFTAPWYKKERFNPKTLKPFDKVLGLMMSSHIWRLGFFSHKKDNEPYYNIVGGNIFHTILPFNSDTEYLVGTSQGAPDFYKYWED